MAETKGEYRNTTTPASGSSDESNERNFGPTGPSDDSHSLVPSARQLANMVAKLLLLTAIVSVFAPLFELSFSSIASSFGSTFSFSTPVVIGLALSFVVLLQLLITAINRFYEE